MAKKKQRKTLWKNNNRKKNRKKIAVRETGVYIGIMGEKLRVALEAPRTSQPSIVLRLLRGALNWAPIMPREASL